MKVWGLALLPYVLVGSTLFTAGCAGTARPPGQVNAMAGDVAPVLRAPAASLSPETRSFVDRLRGDASYRPAPTGGEGVTSWVEFAPGAYIAQGWPWYSICRLSRPRDCAPAFMRCETRPFYDLRPYCPRRPSYPRSYR